MAGVVRSSPDERDESSSPAAKRPRVPVRLGTVPLDSEGRTLAEYRRQQNDAKALQAHANKYRFLEQIRDHNGLTPDQEDYDPRRLYVPQTALSSMTNFERQYWEIKMNHWDTVLFFKKGKFYELYERDADIGHQRFGLKMADSSRGSMRLVGIPEQSFSMWAARFIGAGYKLGRVEQMQSRAQADRSGTKTAVVQRELCQVLTLATLTELDMLTDHTPHFLMAVKECEGAYGVCIADTSRGMFRMARLPRDDHRSDFITILHSTKPKEVLLERGGVSKLTLTCIDKELGGNVRKTYCTTGMEFPSGDGAREVFKTGEYFSTAELPEGLEDMWGDDLIMAAFGAVAIYLREAKTDKELLSMKNFGRYDPSMGGSALALDGTTLANLEVLENSHSKTKAGTLLEHVSHCVTPFGKRKLHQWLCSPLRRAVEITRRQDAVAELVRNVSLRLEIQEALKKLPDLERNLSRLGVAGREREVAWVDAVAYNKKIVLLFLSTITAFRTLHHFIEEREGSVESDLLGNLTAFKDSGGAFPSLITLLDRFERSFDREKALTDGEVVPIKGANPDYDEAMKKDKEIRARLDEALKVVRAHYGNEKGIKFVDFGKDRFLIEVPKAAMKGRKNPNGFEEKSDNKTFSRFKYSRIEKDVEAQAIQQEELDKVKRQVLKKLLLDFASHRDEWKAAIDCISDLDCLCSLAVVSSLPGMCRPVVRERGPGEPPLLRVKGVVHPLVRPAVGSRVDTVVPNDINLGGEDPAVALITGPNMGGKSTVMRSACIVVIFSQLGCFVPAQEVELTPVDRIFTRIGACDRILSGLSTFMVEMRETSCILGNATEDSFVVLDELGRGTATTDGYAIAYAVLIDIAQRLRCRTMFSSHYHFLCQDVLARPSNDIAMYRMAYELDEATRSVTFLYRFIKGVTSESYGVDVAKKAELPSEVLQLAQAKANECRKKNEFAKNTRLLQCLSHQVKSLLDTMKVHGCKREVCADLEATADKVRSYLAMEVDAL